MFFKHLISIGLLCSLATAQSLNDTLFSNNQTTMLAGLLNSDPAFLQGLSSVSSNVTLLAPSNNALSALLNSSAGAAVAANPGAVRALLSYHILNGTYPSSNITNMTSFIRTALVNTTYANVTGGQRVEALRLGNNVTFYSGLDNNSTVTQPNITFNNGFIHVIDRVLTIPPPLTEALLDAGLSSLYGAAVAANAVNAVTGRTDITVFAPTNAAFAAAVGNATLNATALTSILSYHIVGGPGVYYSNRLMNGTVLTNGAGNLTISTNANGTFVNNAKIIRANILVAGGVMHIIDNVLNPANPTATPDPSATVGTVAFTGVMSTVGAPFTSNVPSASTTLAGGGPASAASAASSSSSGVAAAVKPMITGAMGVAALYGAGAWAMNL